MDAFRLLPGQRENQLKRHRPEKCQPGHVYPPDAYVDESLTQERIAPACGLGGLLWIVYSRFAICHMGLLQLVLDEGKTSSTSRNLATGVDQISD